MKLPHLPRRFVIVLLVLAVCITSTGFVLMHTRSSAAASAPYFTMKIGGTTYLAQYEGHAYSNQTKNSAYSDFGQWNEYTVDKYGKWHWYGQFSGNEDVYYNGHGKPQVGLNVNVPGIGHIDTYAHEQVLDPALPRTHLPSFPPSEYIVDGLATEPESYVGTRLEVADVTPRNPSKPPFEAVDCETDNANFDNGRFGNGVSQWEWESPVSTPRSARQTDCLAGYEYTRVGGEHLDTYYQKLMQDLAATPNTNPSVLASLNHPQVIFTLPVILALAGGVFFIASAVTGSVCTLFTKCSGRAKTALTAVSLGLGIISGVLGISGGIINAMRTAALASEQAVRISGQAVSQEMAAGAVSEIGSLSPLSSLSSYASAEEIDINALAVGPLEAHG